MAVVTKPITVEVSKPNIFQAIAAKQNDSNSRFLKVTFVNEGEKINITPSAKVTINAERSDGQSQSFFGTVNSDGTATLPLHSWILELVGYVTCDVSIIEGNSKLTCTSFSLLVEEATHGSDDVSSDEQYDVLTDLIESVNVLDDEMIAYTEATYTKIQRTDALESRTSAVEKRVTNLEQGIVPSPFETDSTTAYRKYVPANALPFAEVTKIGGVTRKCENLFNPTTIDTISATNSGVSVVRGADGTSVILNGTCTANTYISIGKVKLGNDNYILHGGSEKCGFYILGETQTNRGGITAVKEADKNSSKAVGVNVISGETYNNFVVYPKIEVGTVETARPYEPYFEGLRSAPVTEVESVGANIFGGIALADRINAVCYATRDEANKTINYTAQAIQGKTLFETFKPNTQYTFIFKGFNSATSQMANLEIEYTDGTSANVSVFVDGVSVTRSQSGKSIRAIKGVWNTANTTLYYEECGIFEGVLTAEDFKPYVKNILPIPEAVRPKNGINENVYDYIEWAEDGTQKSYQRVGKVELGTLDWKSGSSSGSFTAPLADAVNMAYGGVGICSKYDVSYANKDKNLYTTVITGGVMGCVLMDSAYTDLATFKSAMSGVMLYYELSDPIITDISDLLPEDNFIGVEGGGTVTFKNEHEYAVPSEITY